MEAMMHHGRDSFPNPSGYKVASPQAGLRWLHQFSQTFIVFLAIPTDTFLCHSYADAFVVPFLRGCLCHSYADAFCAIPTRIVPFSFEVQAFRGDQAVFNKPKNKNNNIIINIIINIIRLANICSAILVIQHTYIHIYIYIYIYAYMHVYIYDGRAPF